MSGVTFKGYAIHSIDGEDWHKFKVIDFESKPFKDDDVEIKINYSGICSSDVHTLSGGWGKPILPLISGHEIAGRVVRVGKNVQEFKEGDRVGVGAQVDSCGKCDPCKNDRENYCVTGGVDTYNAKFDDGSISHGGYSTAIRTPQRFVFKLPDAIADEDACSMMCGGLTVYAPLEDAQIGPGKKVGIVGIGGLGHYAVQFAHALGADVTAFTHQADKMDDCKKMGADTVIDTSKDGWTDKVPHKYDFILTTVDFAAAVPVAELCSLVKPYGEVHSVGLPDNEVSFKLQGLAGTGAALRVSHIGSKKQAYRMLDLAAKKGVKTWKELIPMKDVEKGVLGVKNNDVRYRYVMKVDI